MIAPETTNTRIWVNGTLHTGPETATICAIDHGVVVGDGVFEAFKAVDGQAFTPTRHLARLARSAAKIGLPAPDLDQVRAGIAACLDGFDEPLGLFRITYTGGLGPLGSGRAYGPTTLVVALQPKQSLPETSTIVTGPWLRNVDSPLAGVKSTSYAENMVALAYATDRGASEAIFANTRGNLCEGTGSNIFAIFGDEVVTPPLSAMPLAGITRGLVLEWGSAAGVRMVERDLTIDEAKSADEIFLTSSLRDVQGITAWDDTTWSGMGPVTARLREIYQSRAAVELDPQ